MQIIDTVEISELDKYTSSKIIDLVTRFKIAKEKKYEDLQKQLWSAFYEIELIRIELDLSMLHFNDKSLDQIYNDMIREARHFVIYGDQLLVRDNPDD